MQDKEYYKVYRSYSKEDLARLSKEQDNKCLLCEEEVPLILSLHPFSRELLGLYCRGCNVAVQRVFKYSDKIKSLLGVSDSPKEVIKEVIVEKVIEKEVEKVVDRVEYLDPNKESKEKTVDILNQVGELVAPQREEQRLKQKEEDKKLFDKFGSDILNKKLSKDSPKEVLAKKEFHPESVSVTEAQKIMPELFERESGKSPTAFMEKVLEENKAGGKEVNKQQREEYEKIKRSREEKEKARAGMTYIERKYAEASEGE